MTTWREMSAISTRSRTGVKLAAAWQGALGHLIWRAAGGALAVVLVFDVWSVFDVAFRSPDAFALEAYLSTVIINLIVVVSIMFTTRVADGFVDKGTSRLFTYALAVLLGSSMGALAQWQVHQWIRPRSAEPVDGGFDHWFVLQSASVGFEYLIWGSIIVWIYVSRRDALRAAARLNSAQVQRTETQRRTLESRLQALQARVEPQFLFSSLTQVHDLYESDPAKGRQVLGDLIAYLRGALPRLREAASTLGSELDLAIAYLNVTRAQAGEHFALAVDASDAAKAARMPAMVLLPLITHILVRRGPPRVGSDTLRIAARAAGGRLRLEIAHSGRCVGSERGDDLHDVEQRLHALYSDEWTLAVERSGDHGTQVILEFPHEATDGSHR